MSYSSTLTTWTRTTTYSNPRLVLRTEPRDDDFMVFGSKQIVRVGSDGKVQWSHEWKWERLKVALVPKYVSQDILYCIDKKFVYLDGKTGQVKWMGEEKAESFFLLPESKVAIAIEGKEIRAYTL